MYMCLYQTPSNSIFFICDIQENFRDKMYFWPVLVAASQFLIKVAVQLDIPIIVSEQKPFKPTIEELGLASIDNSIYPKTSFSMFTPSLHIDLQENYKERKHVFLFGIEAHVCIMRPHSTY